MTWASSTTTHAACDDAAHTGERTSVIVHGVAVTAEDAIRGAGWHYSRRANRHICQACAARRAHARLN